MGSMLSRGADRGRGTWFPPFAVNIPSNGFALVARVPGGLRAVTLEGESGERLLEAALRQRVGIHSNPTTPEEALNPREERASGSADPLVLASANQPQRRRPGAPMTPHTEAASKRRRGSAADALAIASSDKATQTALDTFQGVVYAPGTARTKSALFKLWCDILSARGLPSLPVDVEKLNIVSSVLRAAGFKSAPAYLYEAKDCHMRAGHAWTDALDIALRDCRRGLTRGLGPPCRALEIEPCLWSHLPENPETQCASWPALRKYVWILGSCFCLREVELGCVMLNEVELDEWNSLVTISLTVSKTDQYARGCKRTLGCRCNAKEPVVCPYCVASVLVNHQEVMSGFEHGSEAAAEWPLIGQEGDPSKLVPKESMLAALKEDAIYLKDRGWLKDTADMDLVSGHSLRRSGVKHWVKAGVPEELIMFLTRHSSSAVKAYIEDARETSPVVHNKIAEHQGLQAQISGLVTKVGNLEELTSKITEEHKNEKKVAHFDEDSVKALLRAYLRPPVVTNLATLKFHATSISNNQLMPSRWQTACGWCYVAAGQLVKPAASYEEIPTEASPCAKCMNYLPYWAAV